MKSLLRRPSVHRLLTLASISYWTACGGDDGAPALENTESSTTTDADTGSESGIVLVCVPGETRCNGQQYLETCAPTGREWMKEPCPPNASCHSCDSMDETCAADHCIGPCDVASDLPSSAGCSFIANRQLHPFEEWDDGIVIANPDTSRSATVSLFKIPEGGRKEELVDGFPITLGPSQAISHRINTSFILGFNSFFRTGGMFRITSDLPIIAYQHAPLENNSGNDSSLLLPESALGRDYVVTSYHPVPNPALTAGGLPSYFEIIAIEDGTRVEWTPPVPTEGNGLPIPPLLPGETGMVTMNRFDTMRITASDKHPDYPFIARDVSGTVIHADKPIWVVGATRCAGVPVTDLFNYATCDPLQELLLPLQHWGTRYVAAAPPPREEEWVHWRVYSGESGITVTSDPPLPEFPHTFETRGEYIDISVPPLTHFLIEGDGPFLPVLYLQSHRGESWTDETMTESELFPGGLPGGIGGDPSMAQMVPVEQFLSRYVLLTGIGFGRNWLVVIREQGNADIVVDGAIVDGYMPVGNYEVAHVPLTNMLEDDTDIHIAESEDPFGVLQLGYSNNIPQGEPGADGCVNPGGGGFCNSSYAYPGGMKAEVIYVP